MSNPSPYKAIDIVNDLKAEHVRIQARLTRYQDGTIQITGYNWAERLDATIKGITDQLDLLERLINRYERWL